MTYNPATFIGGGGGGSVTWGGITGTLSSQADLAAALAGKQAAGTYATGTGSASGVNTGDQTSIVGITGTLSQFNAALSGADFASGGGTATGTNTGDQTSVTGNAGTATALATPRTISITGKATAAGGAFDGTGPLAINITAVTLVAGDIPTIAQAQVTNLVSDLAAKAAATSVPNASYRSLLDCTASHIAGRVAGTYWLGQGQPAGITGTGTLYAPNLIYIDSADFPTLNGVAPKLRIRAQLYVNDVAPTGNFTLGLYPVTRPATSGGAGVNIYTMGTVVTGSAPTALVTPAADSMNIIVGSDFALPANGHYVIGMVTTATVAVSSHLHVSAILQMRNA